MGKGYLFILGSISRQDGYMKLKIVLKPTRTG